MAKSSVHPHTVQSKEVFIQMRCSINLTGFIVCPKNHVGIVPYVYDKVDVCYFGWLFLSRTHLS